MNNSSTSHVFFCLSHSAPLFVCLLTLSPVFGASKRVHSLIGLPSHSILARQDNSSSRERYSGELNLGQLMAAQCKQGAFSSVYLSNQIVLD